MINPILQQLTPQNNPNPQSNTNDLAAQISAFQKSLQGKDPKQLVLNMLQQGIMSNGIFQQLMQTAQQLTGYFK